MAGRAWKFGDHMDTDRISPSRYGHVTDPKELARHCMEGEDPEFSTKARPGDVIVGGVNFGCGSSRERAPLGIRELGITCVIAKSFGRIFLRNSINIGLPVIVCPEASDDCETGDILEVDLAGGTITNKTKNRTYRSRPWPEFMRRIVEAGGLIPYYQRQMNDARR